jgi:membrane associated rhomboid family serine protease
MALIRRRYPFTQSLTFVIIALNVIIWVLQILAYPVIDDLFALSAASLSEGRIYQFLSYMFLHATYVETSAGVALYPSHIAVNMLVFAIFGFQLEQVVGRRKFLALYLVSGVGSALFYLFVMNLMMEAAGASLIGASGAVFGVLAAYAFRFPKEWVYMLGFFPMPASLMIVFLLIEETFFGFMGLQPGVANFGHVGGIITGLLLMAAWKIAEIRKEKDEFRHFEYVWE